MADYSGSFSGSFQGTISGSLLGSGIISSSTQIDALFNIDGLISSSAQIAKLGVGIVSSSTQIDFNDIVNKPTTIQPFQTNAIISNNRFREVTYPAISASTSTRFNTIESSVSTLQGQIVAAVSGTVPPGTISGSAQIAALGYLTSASVASGIFTLTGSFYSTTNNIQITGSLSISSGSFKSFEVNSDGFVVLGDMNVVNKDLNNAPIGTIAYSASSFYLIS